MHNIDLSIDHLAKIEGSASLKVNIVDDKVMNVAFKIVEQKRFFTEAMKGKPLIAVPQHLSRICGTCSNAHIMCAIEACEHAYGIEPSAQTKLLRALTMHGLMIRDHALHLYLFVLPDVFNKDNFLDFDEHNPEEHQLLHDGFDMKAAGNFLATLVAGRSVHAMYPTVGGFLHFPDEKGVAEAIAKLEAIRPAVIRLINLFEKIPFHFDRKATNMALVPKTTYGYLDGDIITSKHEAFGEDQFRAHLERTIIPYSQAAGYQYEGECYMVGALARVNLAKQLLHPNTKRDAASALAKFPSTDVFYTNLAQAIEILHGVDESIDILKNTTFVSEPIAQVAPKAGVGIGVIEAPRGTLYHKVELDDKGIVIDGEVIVPTGQNQVNIEKDIGALAQSLLPNTPKETITHEIEKLIRAYDPCMSCASHFLEVEWSEK